MPQKQPLTNKLILSLLLLGILCTAVYAMRHTFSALLFSFVLAYLLDPLVVFLERRRIKRTYGILIVYSVLSIFALFCLTYLVPFFTMRWEALVHDLPEYVQKLRNLVTDWKLRMKPPTYAAHEWNWLLDTIQGNLDAMFAKMGTGAYAMAGKLAVNLINVLLAPIIAFFMLLYKGDIADGVMRWIPAARRDFILSVGHDVSRSIGGFIRGQFFVSFIVAALSLLPLMVLGINHPFFCAIFAGLASIIPFVGVILATIPPLFFAYAEYQELALLLKIIVAFSLIYFLEGYVIKPIIFKESLDLNPLTTIVIVMAFGELMGFWGVILAIPVAASLKIITRHYREYEAARQW